MALCLWWLAGRYFRRTPEALGLLPDGDEGGRGEAPQRWRGGRGRPWRLVVLPGSDRRFATLPRSAFALGLFAQIGLIAHLFSLLVPAMGEAGAGAAMSLFTELCGARPPAARCPAARCADRRIAAALNPLARCGSRVRPDAVARLGRDLGATAARGPGSCFGSQRRQSRLATAADLRRRNLLRGPMWPASSRW